MKKTYFILLCVLAFSCSRTELPFGNSENCDTEINFTDDIQGIINNSCAYSGCHLDVAPGNYTSFQGLQGAINSGEFFTRVLSIRDMPPNYAPEGRPKSLTPMEIELINCWAENDYPQ